VIRCRMLGHVWKLDRIGFRGICRRCGYERHPKHQWADNGLVDEAGIPAQLGRRDIRCTRCGQERRVFWMLDLDSIPDVCPGGRP
jgi:hypothetical protein